MEVNLFQAVKQTVQEHALIQHPVPPAVHQAMDVFAKWHLVYRWVIKDRELIRREQRLIEEGQGDARLHGLGYFIGSEISTTFKYALYLGMIIKCMDELFEHHMRIYLAFRTLKDTRSYAAPLPTHSKHRIKWLFHVSPRTEYWLRTHLDQVMKVCIRIMYCLARIGWEIIKAAMCYRDVYLILTYDTQARLRAYTEFAASLLEYKEKLMKDENFLFKEITKREALLAKMITKLSAEEQTKYSEAIHLAKQKSVAVVVEGINIIGEILSPVLNPNDFGPIELVPETKEPPPKFSKNKVASLPPQQQKAYTQKKVNTFITGSKNKWETFQKRFSQIFNGNKTT